MANFLAAFNISDYEPNSLETTTELDKPDLKGTLRTSNFFFRRRTVDRAAKRMPSDMQNLAKSSFRLNGDNHVALVQYLPMDGMGSEHYHGLDETIVQLAGTSRIIMRPLDNDTEYHVAILAPGESLKIPKGTIHQVTVSRSSQTGSLTVPIKQTNPESSDHFSHERSAARIRLEVNDIGDAHAESGYEEQVSLEKYYASLSEIEKERFNRMFGSMD